MSHHPQQPRPPSRLPSGQPPPFALSPVSPSSTQPPERTTTSSASSSMTNQPSREDQVMYRFYLKTLGVIVEGRLSAPGGKGGERKKDKWFNLTLPETDMYKNELQIYRAVSTYAPIPGPSSGDNCTVPPLLVALVLDTSDIPPGQTLMWERGRGRHPLDLGVSAPRRGKGKEKDERSGIILERWTLRANSSTIPSSSSELRAHTAYRLGIIHFRAVFALVRLLPAYCFCRKLRRAKNGLRLGIKCWGAEGYTNSPEGLAEAWEVMERGLISISTGLQDLCSSDVEPETVSHYDFPSMDLFGTQYSLGLDYRPEVEFSIDDLESVLSEKLGDAEEEWFTPTVTRHRVEEARRVSAPTAIPASASPTPSGQMSATPGSFDSRPGSSRIASGMATRGPRGGSSLENRWGSLGEGLPFAVRPPSRASLDRESIYAQAGASAYPRQPSGQPHYQSYGASLPTTPGMRATPPPRPIYSGSPSSRPPSAISHLSPVQRPSDLLLQSDRSSLVGDLSPTSPIQVLTTSGAGPPNSATSPSSLRSSNRPIPRSISDRPPFAASGSSPFAPGSLEREAPPQIIKRYSSSLSQRQGRLVSGSGSGGSIREGSSPTGSQPTQGPLRRTSTRTSQESGLRRSLEDQAVESTTLPPPDEEEIQAFLKALEALPQPPSLAAQAAQSSRTHLPSTSSSLSVPSASSIAPSPSALSPGDASDAPRAKSRRDSSTSRTETSSGSIGTGRLAGNAMNVPPDTRAPLTRAQADEELKRLAGSRSLDPPPSAIAARAISAGAVSATFSRSSSGVGLISASRPSSTARIAPIGERPVPQRQLSGSSRSKTGSPLAANPIQADLPVAPPIPMPVASPDTTRLAAPTMVTARSLPGPTAKLAEPTPSALSPQTTGGSSTAEPPRTRRAPVLLRGGFDLPASRTSASSPSHSPVRDLTRMGRFNTANGTSAYIGASTVQEGRAEEELGGWARGAQGYRYRPFTTEAARQAGPTSRGEPEGRGRTARVASDSGRARETADEMIGRLSVEEDTDNH